MARGTAIIDFGAFPGSNEATVAVTGQGAITAASDVEPYFMAEPTSDHTALDHAYASRFISLTSDIPTAGAGFNILARSEHLMQGTFNVRWVWL
jgi:hypothetical protein